MADRNRRRRLDRLGLVDRADADEVSAAIGREVKVGRSAKIGRVKVPTLHRGATKPCNRQRRRKAFWRKRPNRRQQSNRQRMEKHAAMVSVVRCAMASGAGRVGDVDLAAAVAVGDAAGMAPWWMRAT